ncbi:VOC family protein [Tropicibacter sp. Alg240-R139]|uniref:VOC family protein n=1 Tax=Tropicibacter sp. Alg240-R139 TaxID=2305991 RepID=UPI0013E017B0|nr:VOC family protein [Tropicibacter sp. Alg240-R139]
MALSSFGYVGCRSSDLPGWKEYGTELLGLQMVDSTRDTLAFRMDDRKQRILIEPGSGGGVSFFGWEAEDLGALDAICNRLEKAGTEFFKMPRALCAQRAVTDGVYFLDPAGNRLEVFYGAEVADDDFVPSRAISGFVTGPLGLGHIAIYVDNLDTAHKFYTDVLGFGLSDYVTAPFRANFYHINPRHHSLALIEGANSDVHHMMMELYQLDDVGQGYDIALEDPEKIATTLGRHSNDFMTSFYTRTPSKFLMEYGWGGKLIDVNTWEPFELKVGPSLWGHERSWLDDEGRAKAKELRMAAAADGVQEPVYVADHNFIDNGINCAWWQQAHQK